MKVKVKKETLELIISRGHADLVKGKWVLNIDPYKGVEIYNE